MRQALTCIYAVGRIAEAHFSFLMKKLCLHSLLSFSFLFYRFLQRNF